MPEVRKDTFKARVIWHAFRETGILLINPDIVINQLNHIISTAPDDEEILRI